MTTERAPTIDPWRDLTARAALASKLPAPQLVYAAGREHVTHVFVNGQLLVREGALRGSAFSGLDTRWQLWQNALAQHADS